MTVSSATNRIAYSGTTGTTFPYTFKVFADADLLVVKRLVATGEETTLALTTDYTVTGAGDSAGGNVVLGTALTTDYSLVIKRDLGILQEVDYVDNDPFPAETHEEALDRLTMIAQQLDEALGRSVLLPVSSAVTDLELPEPVDGYLLGWSGTTLVNKASAGTISVTTFAQSLLDDATAAEARATIGPTITGNALKVLSVNAGESDTEWVNTVVRGYHSGMEYTWGSASSFTLAAGSIEINGVEYTASSTITKSGISGLSNSTFYYIYAAAPASGTALSATEITLSSTAPTFDATKNGWYDAGGTKRCLQYESGWFTKTDGSGNLIQARVSADGMDYLWDLATNDISNQAPSNTPATYTVNAPPNMTAIGLVWVAYSNVADISLFMRQVGSSSTGNAVAFSPHSTGYSEDYLGIPTDSSSQVQFFFAGATTNTFSFRARGVRLRGK